MSQCVKQDNLQLTYYPPVYLQKRGCLIFRAAPFFIFFFPSLYLRLLSNIQFSESLFYLWDNPFLFAVTKSCPHKCKVPLTGMVSTGLSHDSINENFVCYSTNPRFFNKYTGFGSAPLNRL